MQRAGDGRAGLLPAGLHPRAQSFPSSRGIVGTLLLGMDTSTRTGEEIAGGRYKLLKPLGRGTFGDVYLAECSKPEMTQGAPRVVVRSSTHSGRRWPEVVERFRREAQVAENRPSSRRQDL